MHNKYAYEVYSHGRDKIAPFTRECEERRIAIGQASQLLEEEAGNTSTVVTTANDLRDAVRILKKRPDGMSLSEAMDAFKKRVLDPRKIALYEHWGIVLCNGNRISLSPLGWDLARRLEPEVSIFRAVLHSILIYRSALEMIYDRQLDRITHPDVTVYWKEHYTATVYALRENVIQTDAICFFHLCQAAELGTVTLGKKGQPARLQVDRQELERHIRVASSFPTAKPAEEVDAGGSVTLNTLGNRRRVFISSNEKSPVVEQVQSTLALAGFESEVIEREGTGACPLTERLCLAMRNSVAGIIILDSNDCSSNEAGNSRLDERMAMIIGATCAFCDNRVVLLRENNLTLPSYLVALDQCEFQSSNLSWKSGVQLIQVIKRWKT